MQLFHSGDQISEIRNPCFPIFICSYKPLLKIVHGHTVGWRGVAQRSIRCAWPLILLYVMVQCYRNRNGERATADVRVMSAALKDVGEGLEAIGAKVKRGLR